MTANIYYAVGYESRPLAKKVKNKAKCSPTVRWFKLNSA